MVNWGGTRYNSARPFTLQREINMKPTGGGFIMNNVNKYNKKYTMPNKTYNIQKTIKQKRSVHFNREH